MRKDAERKMRGRDPTLSKRSVDCSKVTSTLATGCAFATNTKERWLAGFALYCHSRRSMWSSWSCAIYASSSHLAGCRTKRRKRFSTQRLGMSILACHFCSPPSRPRLLRLLQFGPPIVSIPPHACRADQKKGRVALSALSDVSAPLQFDTSLPTLPPARGFFWRDACLP